MNLKTTFKNFFEAMTRPSLRQTIIQKIFDGTIAEEDILMLLGKEAVLFKETKTQKSIVEYMLIYNVHSDILDGLCKTNTKAAKLYLKYKKYQILGEAQPEILNTPIDGKTILDYIYTDFLNNPNYPETDKYLTRTNILALASINYQIAKTAYSYKFYAAALKNEEFLLEQALDKDELNLDTIIKKLLETNQIQIITSIEYTGRLLTHKSPHLNNQMIIEYILNNFKDSLALDELSYLEETLLYQVDDNTTILEYLITKDRKLVEKIYHIGITKRPKIQKILHDNGFNINMSIPFNEKEQTIIYDFVVKNDQEIPTNFSEEQALIDEFRNIMLKDKRSDIEVVNLACNSFYYQFSIQAPYALRDLQSLINIKKQNPRFSLKKGKKKDKIPNFNSATSTIYIYDLSDIYTFTHEATHAIHYYCNQHACPQKFITLAKLTPQKIEKIKNLSETLKKRFYDALTSSQSAKQLNEQLAERLLPLQKRYLTQLQKSLTKAAKDKEFPKEYVEYLSNNILSPEEFTEIFRKSILLEQYALQFNQNHKLEFCLIDIFDSLSYGRFPTYGIENNGRLNFHFKSNHDYDYFIKVPPFNEIIAQYATIIKSPQRQKLITVLIDVMGQEFVDMLEEFYDKLYVEDKTKEKEGVRKYGL